MRNSARRAALAALVGAALAGAALPGGAAAQPVAPEVRGWVIAPGLPADAPVRVELVAAPSLYQQVVRWIPDRAPSPPLAVARPGADGTFRVAAPAAGLYRIVVRAPGRVPMQRDLVPLVHDLELPPVELPVDRRLRVRTVDESGAPVAGARVSVLRGRGEVWRRRRGWRPLREVVASGADGWATVAAAAGESVVVGAGAAGRLAATVDGVSGDEAAVVLAPALERQVEVRRRGRPVPEAAIWVPAGDRQVAVADERGRAWLTLPAGEAVEVWVETPDGWRGRHRVRTGPAAPPGDGAGAAEPTPGAEGTTGAAPADPAVSAPATTAAATSETAAPAGLDPLAGFETTASDPASPPGHLDPRPPLVLSVEPPSLFAGRVLAARGGAAVAGALVWAAGDEGSAVLADDAGRFALPLVGEASLRLGAAAPGFRPAEVAVEPAAWPRGGDGLVLSLAEAYVVAGEVVDPAGRPIAEARVLLRSRGSRPGWDPASEEVSERAVDERGRFRFDNRWGGMVVLRAEAPGRAAVERTVGATAEGLRVVLGEGGALRGRLVAPLPADLAAGRAQLFAEDAQEQVFEDGVPVGGLPVALSTDGELHAERIAAGRYELLVRVPGHQPLAHGEIDIDDGEETDLGDLELLPEAVLAGRVVDDQGRPVAAAAVEVHAPRQWSGSISGRNWREVETDGEGRFEIGGLTEDVPVSLVARAEGYAPAAAAEVWPPREEPVVLTLVPGATVFGRLVDAAGAPIADAGLQAHGLEDAAASAVRRGWPHAFVRSGEDGGFELRGLPPEPIRLRVFARDHRHVERTLEALAPGERRGPVIVEVPSGVELAGSVRHADGRPGSGARVWVQPREGSAAWSGATADAAGRFRVVGSAPGRVLVVAQLQSGGRAEAEAVAGSDSEVELVLDPPTGISGRVVGPDGAPVAKAMVSLRQEHGSQGRSAEDDGRFEMLDLEAGTYRLSGQAPGIGYVEHPEPLVLAEGTVVRDLVLRLGTGGSIAGRVLGLSPGELSRLRVGAWRMASNDAMRVEGSVGGGGAFEIRGLPPGRYRVSATLPDVRRGEEMEVELTADERREGIEIDLSGFRLAVEARLNGATASGRMRVVGDRVMQGSRSLGAGRFLFEGLEPGTYRLGLLPAADGVWLEQEVEVLGDGELAVDFDAWPVEGWAVDAAGAPVAAATIELVPLTPTERSFRTQSSGEHRTDAAGRFVLPLVPAGGWQLVAFTDDGRQAVQRLDVPPGGIGGLTLVLGAPPPPAAPPPAPGPD